MRNVSQRRSTGSPQQAVGPFAPQQATQDETVDTPHMFNARYGDGAPMSYLHAERPSSSPSASRQPQPASESMYPLPAPSSYIPPPSPHFPLPPSTYLPPLCSSHTPPSSFTYPTPSSSLPSPSSADYTAQSHAYDQLPTPGDPHLSWMSDALPFDAQSVGSFESQHSIAPSPHASLYSHRPSFVQPSSSASSSQISLRAGLESMRLGASSQPAPPPEAMARPTEATARPSTVAPTTEPLRKRAGTTSTGAKSTVSKRTRISQSANDAHDFEKSIERLNRVTMQAVAQTEHFMTRVHAATLEQQQNDAAMAREHQQHGFMAQRQQSEAMANERLRTINSILENARATHLPLNVVISILTSVGVQIPPDLCLGEPMQQLANAADGPSSNGPQSGVSSSFMSPAVRASQLPSNFPGEILSVCCN